MAGWGAVRLPAAGNLAWWPRASARPSALIGWAIAGALVLYVLSTASVWMFEAYAPSLPLALAAGLAGVGILALAIVRYDGAVAVGLLLMAVVEFEPAPPDGAFAVIIAVAIATGRFRPTRAPLAVTALIGLLIVLNAASMLASFDLVVALRFSLITVFLAALAVWLVGWIDSVCRSRIVVVTWLLAAVLSSLVGMAVVSLPIPGGELLTDGTQSRANVLFEDANVYGPYLVPIAAILLEERLRPRLLRLGPTVSGVLFFVLAVGTIVSFSRAAWLNFIVAIVVMLSVVALRRRGGRGALRMLGTLAVVALAVTGVMSATASLPFFEERTQVQSYDTERFAAQRAGLELGMRYPAGVGPGQFRFHHPVETHSTYIRVLAEQGLLGLVAWLGLVGVTLGLAVGNALAGRDTFGIGSAALLGSWCGLLVNSAVVDTLHWRHLWVVAALIWAGSVRGRPGQTLGGAIRPSPLARAMAGPRRRPRRPNPTGVASGRPGAPGGSLPRSQ